MSDSVLFYAYYLFNNALILNLILINNKKLHIDSDSHMQIGERNLDK